MLVREIPEYALNTIHEQSVVVFLTHHYNHDVVTAFTGGGRLHTVDLSVPTEERIDAAVKRVQKSIPSAKASIDLPGIKGKGSAGGEGGGKMIKWSHGKHQ